MPAAVIFDNDGLTLDTEHTWTRAEQALYARYDTEFTLDHKREMLGTSGAKSAGMMERHLDQPGRGAELNAELRELVHAELDGSGVQPMPGVIALLDALEAHGVRFGLATNSGRQFATNALRSAACNSSSPGSSRRTPRCNARRPSSSKSSRRRKTRSARRKGRSAN